LISLIYLIGLINFGNAKIMFFAKKWVKMDENTLVTIL